MSSGFYDSKFKVTGNVTIDPSVAIAPGVLIQADPDSQIIIAAGVCIGAGTIIHAYTGVIEIGVGVAIAAEVLIVGSSKIGANACIGSQVTIYNHDVVEAEVLVSGALIGDRGREASFVENTPTAETHPIEVPPTEIAKPEIAKPEIAEIDNIDSQFVLEPNDLIETKPVVQIPEPQAFKSTYVYESVKQVPIGGLTDVQYPEIQKVEYKSTYVDEPSQKLPTSNAPINDPEVAPRTKVYGQAKLNNLLAMLLPHRQALSQPLQE